MDANTLINVTSQRGSLMANIVFLQDTICMMSYFPILCDPPLLSWINLSGFLKGNSLTYVYGTHNYKRYIAQIDRINVISSLW